MKWSSFPGSVDRKYVTDMYFLFENHGSDDNISSKTNGSRTTIFCYAQHVENQFLSKNEGIGDHFYGKTEGLQQAIIHVCIMCKARMCCKTEAMEDFGVSNL